MSTTRRGTKFAALALGLALVAAACGDDDESTSDTAAQTPTSGSTATTTAGTEAPETSTATSEATDTTTAGTTEGTGGGGGEGQPMTITYTLSDAAVWSDGTPMSAADFECTTNAILNTPGSISTVGYDLVTSVEQGASEKEVVVTFEQPFAAWKTLYGGLLKADEYEDCNDVSEAFATGAYTYGAGPYLMTSWSAEQVVYEKNAEYKGANTGGPDRVVFVPAEDGPTLLKAGTVDFIYPQAYTGIDAELSDPNVAFDAEPGGQFEALYFMQADACTPDETRSCAFADDDYRAAFSKSIDLQGVYEQIYAPFAQGLPLLECGPIAPGPYCDPVFTDTYDAAGAEQIMTDAGWTKNAEGFWANADGEVPEVKWMVNTGNTRRESTQEYLIPKLAEAGFKVVADNCEAVPCVFQTRLPALQYDLAMYISTVAPDPIYITSAFVCDQIPSEENDFQGQNSTGWCNEEASAALKEADVTLDEDKRAELVKSAIAAMKEDYAILPTLQFPNIGAYRTDKVSGTQNNLANYWAFGDWWNFEDVDGDGQVIIGAEQFPAPDCTNPVTECSNSSWFQWVAGFPTFPGMYSTTNEQTFEPSEYLAGEAEVSVG